jgi:molybdopterin/thiamine biosynthesis adenylyltransferase
MSTVSFTRQSAILDPDLAASTHVTVCGLGTVGSHAAVELARLGIGALTVIDADVVEAHNLPSQAYELADVDRPKAEALADRIAAVSSAQVTSKVMMLDGGEPFPAGPVVLAVDNMEARKSILELSVANSIDHPLVIDGRMGGKMWQLLALDPTEPDQVERWVNNHYFPQEEAAEIPCGGRTVSFIGSFIGGTIASYICRNLNDEPVPFYLSGDLDSYLTQRLD